MLRIKRRACQAARSAPSNLPYDAGTQGPLSISQERHLVSAGGYKAWLFDLDGVITDTASVHAAVWKGTFDEYLKVLSEREGGPFEPFEIVDAISGVQAGRTGGFGLVIGVARSHDPEVLRHNGAGLVVRDLAELSLV
jgi:beta-phosphoglucomutase-like phosphatase (HAD superfamily)